MIKFIDTRAAAEAEAKSQIRSNKRSVKKYGMKVAINPFLAAADRRENAKFSLRVARDWQARGNMENAVKCGKIARGHLIIARAWDKEEQK